MDLLRSSILGKEFIMYRKNTTDTDRFRFYKKATNSNKIPVVVDSVDEEFIEIFRKKYYIGDSRIVTYGLLLELSNNATINDVLKEIKIELVKANKEYIFIENDIKLGLENGNIISNNNLNILELYNEYKNRSDKILYILITKETTMYNYIISIIRSIYGMIYKK